MAGGAVLLTAMLTAQSPAADSLRILAHRLPQSALMLETRAQPAAAREAVTGALARAEIAVAHNLAAAYAAAWSDSFFVREVGRFVAWPPERQAAKVWLDSVRRAGVTTFSRDGAAAAIAVWRRALSRAEAIGDTAGVAALLGNIGAGLLEQGQLDSAEAYFERSRALAAGIGDLRVEANAIGALAEANRERGELEAARAGYARAWVLRGRIGDTRGQAADLNNLGLLAQVVGDIDEARRQFEAALALNRRDGRDEVAATNLVNLAGLASLAGDFARAEGLYRDALATWRGRGQWVDAADALHGLGQLELRRGDYRAARAALLEALVIYDRTGPLVNALAVRRELAGALGATGELQGALDELRRAQQLADSARAPPGSRAGLALARADLAMQLNALAEADRLYGRAEFLYRQAGDAGGSAEAQHGRGLLSLARDNPTRAQTQLDAALRAQASAGNQRAAALVRLSLGQLAWERGDTVTARRQLTRAVADLQRVGDPVATAAALAERGALEAEAGLVAPAESLYRAGLGVLGDRIAPEVAWQLHAGLALARRAQHDADGAARELRAAITELERPSRSLALAERRSGFFADKWDVHAQLAITEQRRGRSGAAFEASERLRAREMLELLAHGRIPGPPDTAADLVGREQDLRRRIAELTREAEGGASGTEALRGADGSGGGAGGGAARDALLRAQEAYGELLLEARERAPRHAGLVSRETAAWREVARRLGPDQALIEYLVSDSGSLAFVVVPDRIATVDLGVGRRDLARLVEFARGTLEPPGAGPRRADSLWRGPLRRLHRYLIGPIEETGLLAGKTRLVLVPHAELHYLPFAALVNEADGARARFLVERYELAVAQSASVWLALADRRRGPAGAGMLALAPRPDVLPASRQEVEAIARGARREAEVVIGRGATEEVFRREAVGRRVLHLATYGVLNKHNPLFSFVELVPGGGHDGRLEVHEVFGLELAAELVVLSACQTGLGSGAQADVPAGDDWVGLTRAFLHAGAAQVVATLWPVEDVATAVLMERLYEGLLSGADAPRALAGAQRALLTSPAAAHPFYWAGFVAVGGAERRER